MYSVDRGPLPSYHCSFSQLFSEVTLSTASAGVRLLLDRYFVLEDVSEVHLLPLPLSLREGSSRVYLLGGTDPQPTPEVSTTFQTCGGRERGRREGRGEGERGREEGREGGREGGRERRQEGGREGGREGRKKGKH